MNKYQEALDNLVHCKSETKCKECRHKDRCTMDRDYKILKELVDKETPKKVVEWEIAKPITRCPKCGAGLARKDSYCWNCGQKIHFEESENND